MFEQIRSNQRRSAVLIAGMAGLLLFLGYALGEMLAPGAGPGGLFVAAAVWFVQIGVAYFQGDRIFLAMSGARRIEKKDHPRLFNVVEEMTIAAGLPKPPGVYIIDDPAPNAFATGRKPETASVAVTTGLLERLDRDEIQGVIAHEIGHIRNRDIQFMLWAGIMVGTIVLLADIGARSLRYGGGSRRTSSGRRSGGAHPAILIIGLLMVILAPILAQLLYFACSRKREYLADASGALFTRYPEGLARALEKIAKPAKSPLAAANRVTAPMYIVNPLEVASAALSGEWLSTHPRTENRIRILRSMGGASFADYERAWERATGRSALMSEATVKQGAAAALRDPGAAEPDAAAAHRAQAREATDLLWSLNGYRIVGCPCGARLKIPPVLATTRILCPRCGKTPVANEV